MKKLLLIGGAVGLLTISGIYFISLPKNKTETTQISITPIPQVKEVVEKKAAFAIFTNGTFRVFTAPMYHNLSPDVFIDSSNPNVVQVKKEGITWEDFFKTLPFKLGKDCLITGTKQTFCTNNTHTLKFYINAKLDPEALERQLNDGDKLLISYGVKNDSEVENQLRLIPKIK